MLFFVPIFPVEAELRRRGKQGNLIALLIVISLELGKIAEFAVLI